MKTLMKILSLVFAFSILFTGCKKNDSDDDTGYLQLSDNTSYPMSQVASYYFGTSALWSDYCFQIYLLSEGVVVDENGNWIGSGDYIEFELSTSTSSGIASGTYTYQLFSSLSEGHYDQYSKWMTGLNYGTNATSGLASGDLIIKNKGNDNYEITFDGTDSDGHTVKAYYKGTINKYVASAGGKSGAILSNTCHFYKSFGTLISE
jgi:hypothetical protein